uniref:N-acetyltransferase domain-containing protein n=1 Tax=Strombidium rassoulzadegani TaxID=1082188 RepID=A0A7S3FXW6_9SPIT|mmetsp:Transcript_8531/g.14385  ORF Transcript_8531/g.14385 Transcript_8531/m.14385 type:complete len:222 (+) Transcript_8531:27-692(+)
MEITTMAKEVDEGQKIIMKQSSEHKIPIPDQLPDPDERLYYNQSVKKPKRKIKSLPIQFGKLTNQNVEQFRILNYLTLPVIYSDDFYERLTNYRRYSILGYYKDLLVGAISCRYEDDEETGGRVVYIMTITVLKAYRRYGIGTQLLKRAMIDCKAADVKRIYLHVLCSNESAIEFYKSANFTIKEKLLDYYTDLDPPHCFIFERSLEDITNEQIEQIDAKK